jgi:hypothetical protein
MVGVGGCSMLKLSLSRGLGLRMPLLISTRFYGVVYADLQSLAWSY